jgi:2-polyprenyl-3-methyl-5-hydroxy-6-metoxy-1,4-benzoquinol methylase
MNTESLRQWREKAAADTLGISNDDIYGMVERVLVQHRLEGRVIDFGAGVGNLTRRLLQMKSFSEVHAVDIMPLPEGLNVPWIQQDLNESIPGFGGYFDVVIASEVIEHLENPRHTIRELARLCRAGGHVIITTPNNESIRSLLALVLRGHFVDFDKGWYPGHITPVLRKDFTRMFTEAGLLPLEFGFTRYGSLPGRPIKTWQAVSFGLLKGLRFSNNLLAHARKPKP